MSSREINGKLSYLSKILIGNYVLSFFKPLPLIQDLLERVSDRLRVCDAGLALLL